jgi:hypothetical protein
MVYFTVRGLKERFYMQVTLGVMRFVIAFLMVVTALENETSSIDIATHNPHGYQIALPIISYSLYY